jgi:FtsP/CotA-like multicopper oxidase with cupredoxin domain
MSKVVQLLLFLSAFGLSPLALSANYTLYIEDGYLTINGDGGDVINVWGYTDANGAPPMVPGPILEARQGEATSIKVVNNHNQNHNFVIQGVTSDTTSISPGNSRTYNFTPSKGGVFFYRDTLSSNVNREMGLHGALIVRSNSSSRVWDNGPSYNFERLWVLTDMDVPRWNNRASAGQSVSTGTYRPNYFMINGQGGFDGMHDPNTVLQGNSGQVGLVRIVNAGQFDQSLHWHGNHFQVIDRNGTHLSQYEWQDTINVKAGQTAMVLYQMRRGMFPMHVHAAQMETANGVYLNGTATLIVGN